MRRSYQLKSSLTIFKKPDLKNGKKDIWDFSGGKFISEAEGSYAIRSDIYQLPDMAGEGIFQR